MSRPTSASGLISGLTWCTSAFSSASNAVVRLRRYPPESDVADVVEGDQGDVVARMHDPLVTGVQHRPLQVQDLISRTHS